MIHFEEFIALTMDELMREIALYLEAWAEASSPLRYNDKRMDT